jgi:SpoVK/Ycf46/Vps4 family AAA+-type ATPase
MSIPPPEPDSLRYQELFDEALRRIPTHSPQWTNFNQSDPGVTLVQLFAWVADALHYRLDTIPESHRPVLRKVAARLRPCARVLIVGGNKRDRSAPVQFIAGKFALSLCCIDLATIVSKYLDETEKNLRQLFDAVKNRGAILLFDEADAVFGKRSKVTVSHDRYANIQVNYLLQRLDEFKSIALLASRRRENFDTAFLRRFKWIISVGKNPVEI